MSIFRYLLYPRPHFCPPFILGVRSEIPEVDTKTGFRMNHKQYDNYLENLVHRTPTIICPVDAATPLPGLSFSEHQDSFL